jgi:acetyl-CoA synthetase
MAQAASWWSKPWPSMIRTIWGDPERFKKSYFPTSSRATTWPATAPRSEDRGYFTITGRIDDVLNVSGHRMGTMEIESALVAKTDLVAEAAVVGRPDDLTGEAICAFVVLKRGKPTGDEARQIATELRNWVARRSARCQAQGHPLRRQPAQDPQRQDHAPPAALAGQGRGDYQDTSTLENPRSSSNCRRPIEPANAADLNA